MKQVGDRVILISLLVERSISGKIIAIDKSSGLCTVKLDTQDKPVSGVLWYDERPEIVNSPLWQICFPLEKS